MSFHIYCVCVHVSERQVTKGRRLWPCPLLIPPELQPQRSPNPLSAERKGKWPNSNRKCCKVTSSSLQGDGDGMLLWMCACVCVCTCVADGDAFVCVGLPLVLLHHCFSSLGQETAVKSEAEVKVCTQPFEGYCLPKSIKLHEAGLLLS